MREKKRERIGKKKEKRRKKEIEQERRKRRIASYRGEGIENRGV